MYHMMVQENNNHFLDLPISKSTMFKRTEKANKESYRIKEIDDFTTQFDNEYELRKHLVKEGILPIELIDKPLSIRTFISGKTKKVMYGLLFKKDQNQLNNPEYLVKRIMKKYHNGDLIFIKKLGNHYIDNGFCKIIAADVRNCAADSLNCGKRSKLFDDIDKNGHNIVEKLIRFLVYGYSYDQPKQRTTCHLDLPMSRNVHDLIAFTNYYDEGVEQSIGKEVSREILLELKEELEYITSKASRNKIRKIKQVIGQFNILK